MSKRKRNKNVQKGNPVDTIFDGYSQNSPLKPVQQTHFPFLQTPSC